MSAARLARRIGSAISCLGAACLAAVLTPTAGIGQEAAKQPEYRLQLDDVISITVFGQAEYGLPSARVGPDGRVGHPFLGPLLIVGQTPTEVAALVTERLKAELRDPIVTVSVLQFREPPREVLVIGAVNRPGPITVDGPITAFKAVALAGEPTSKADLHNALLVPRDAPPQALDIANLAGLDPEPLLQPGDALVIREADRRVIVMGAVERPGPIEVAPDRETVREVLAEAGGFTEGADPAGALLIRPGRGPAKIDLSDLFAGDTTAGNQRLSGGDILIVPTLEAEIAVWGAVSAPGKYPIRLGKDRVSDALAEAGGPTASANLAAANLVRATGQVTTIDLAALLQGRNREQDVLLEPGDLLTLAEQRTEAFILGAVEKPGPVQIMPKDQLVNVFALAGGPAKTADLAKVRIIRGAETTMVVNAKPLLEDFELATDIPVQPGDIIIVPEAEREVMVFGAVAKPGVYQIDEGDTVLNLIAQVGQFAERAKPSRTALIRVEGSKANVYIIDVPKLIRGQLLDKNYPLQPGDVLLVPRSQGLDWRSLLSELYQASLLINIIQ